jgi:hypothetical protein
MLRKILGPKTGEVTGKWKGEEVHDLYVSLNIIRVIKSRRMRWGDM